MEKQTNPTLSFTTGVGRKKPTLLVVFKMNNILPRLYPLTQVMGLLEQKESGMFHQNKESVLQKGWLIFLLITNQDVVPPHLFLASYISVF